MELRMQGYSTAEAARHLELDSDSLRVRLSRLGDHHQPDARPPFFHRGGNHHRVERALLEEQRQSWAIRTTPSAEGIPGSSNA